MILEKSVSLAESCSTAQRRIVSYATILIVLEKQQRFRDVDDILENVLGSGELRPNEVVLGGLLNCAADARDWKRAHCLWNMLVTEKGIKPHDLAYNAYAKACFLSGRPEMAVLILDEMYSAGVGQPTYRHAVDYLQYVVILCYSSPCDLNRRRLSRHMADWSAEIHSEASGSGARAWRELSAVAKKLLVEHAAETDGLQFKELLVTYQARQQSVMRDWTEWRTLFADQQPHAKSRAR